MKPEEADLLLRLLKLIKALRVKTEMRGIITFIPTTGGARTELDQVVLYQKGRKLEGGVWIPRDPITHAGIVTYALPINAPHCIRRDLDGAIGSAACDLTIVVGGSIAWKEGDPGYDKYLVVGNLGEECGLVWGGRWPKPHTDLDHFELPDWRSLPLVEV